MSLKKDYLAALGESDIENMMDLGLKYYQGLKYDPDTIPDIITKDIRRFYFDPLEANNLFLVLVEKFNSGEITAEQLAELSPTLNL